MRIFSVATLFVGAVGITALPAATAAQQEQGRDVTVWNWEGKVDAGHWFNLNNVNGSVTIDQSRDNSVHVRAEKFPHDDGDIRDVRFVVIQSGGDVRICALSKENDRCDEDGFHSYGDDDRRGRRNRNVEVKFTVQVPRGVRVGAGTVNGSMRVSGTGAEVRASTVNGGVEVSDAGGPGEWKYQRAHGKSQPRRRHDVHHRQRHNYCRDSALTRCRHLDRYDVRRNIE